MTGRRSLATRIAASCLLVAVVAVGAAGLVSVRLIFLAGQEVARDLLARQADVVAAQLEADIAVPVRRRVTEVLRGQGISIVAINGAGRPVSGDPAARVAAQAAGVDAVGAGTPVSGRSAVGGQTMLVEARPTGGGGIALVRAVDTGGLTGSTLRRNLVFALLAGGAVALVVGGVVGRLLARPLRRTAEAAHTLRSGRRDVRIPVSGPAEIAEVAGAVNELADALARSEARQRAFLVSVSHELRTPLTAVSGFAESLADGVVTGAEVAPVGRTVLREAHRLQRLVDDLMELARLQADDFRLDPVPIDLAALSGEAAEVWRERCRSAGAVFRREGPAGPVPVVADPRRLRQVLDGLAENALRVIPAGGPLVVATYPASDGRGVLEVRDGGPGLTEADLAVAFEPGALHERYRDQRPVGVGGVGLALVRGLVVRMGGAIEAGRAPEGGARFRVWLPGPRPPARGPGGR